MLSAQRSAFATVAMVSKVIMLLGFRLSAKPVADEKKNLVCTHLPTPVLAIPCGPADIGNAERGPSEDPSNTRYPPTT